MTARTCARAYARCSVRACSRSLDVRRVRQSAIAGDGDARPRRAAPGGAARARPARSPNAAARRAGAREPRRRAGLQPDARPPGSASTPTTIALDDVRPDAQAREAARLRALLERLRAIDDEAARRARTRSTALLLERRAEHALFELTELRPLERNPRRLRRPGAVGASTSWSRTTSLPPTERLRAITARLWKVRPLLDEARRNLRARPRPSWRCARDRAGAGGARAFIAETLPQGGAGRPTQADGRFRAADGDAARALDDFVGWLQRDLLPRARGDFALGRERLLEKLRLAEGVEASRPSCWSRSASASSRRRAAATTRRRAAARRGKPGVDVTQADRGRPRQARGAAAAGAGDASRRWSTFVRDAAAAGRLPEPERPQGDRDAAGAVGLRAADDGRRRSSARRARRTCTSIPSTRAGPSGASRSTCARSTGR